MRAITEQLYQHGDGAGTSSQNAVPQLGDVQQSLDPATVLLEFYNDGAQLWCFSLDHAGLEVHALPLPAAELDRLLAQLQVNFAAALGADKPAVARNLSLLAQRLLQRLHSGLLAPLAHRLRGRRRLMIVPYGALHYLPFHLLHTGAGFLIEQHEVVVLPSAALATRHGPVRARGARALAHSWSGRLPHTAAEAQMVQAVFGGETYVERAVRREVLGAEPTQILHIAAHGEQRLDQPDLSYIQFADGQLYADDLLQHDLSYELVTLSACETGRAHVAPGDELIGLGRGFLYAGAGALIVSLWRVGDAASVELMEHVYTALERGASKAAALRGAQLALLSATPGLHPAVWGAFQLIGDAAPLSRCGDAALLQAQQVGAAPALP
jgi:CHAT domain-containing protein